MCSLMFGFVFFEPLSMLISPLWPINVTNTDEMTNYLRQCWGVESFFSWPFAGGFGYILIRHFLLFEVFLKFISIFIDSSLAGTGTTTNCSRPMADAKKFSASRTRFEKYSTQALPCRMIAGHPPHRRNLTNSTRLELRADNKSSCLVLCRFAHSLFHWIEETKCLICPTISFLKGCCCYFRDDYQRSI